MKIKDKQLSKLESEVSKLKKWIEDKNWSHISAGEIIDRINKDKSFNNN